MSTTESIRNRAADAHDQIAELRAQIETLMNDRVRPAISDAAGRAEVMARSAGDAARDQADHLAARVRKQPLASLVVVGVCGFLLGRLFR